MPVSDLDIANSLYWLFGYGPHDGRAGDIVERLHLRAARDVMQLRHALLTSPDFHRSYMADFRPPSFGALDRERPRLAFLHIPKCGGTTLHAILAEQFHPSLICPERFNGLRGHRLDDLAAFTLFSGHFDLESCEALPSRRVDIVTMLREPRARLISLYDFLRIHVPEAEPATAPMVTLARSLDITAFFGHPAIRRHPSIFNGMTALLTQPCRSLRWEALEAPGDERTALMEDPATAGERAFSALAAMTSFGILEDFSASLEVLSAALGLDLENTAPRQVTDEMRHSAHLSYADPPAVTEGVMALLDGLTEADRVLYAKARALFAARVAAVRDPAPPHEAPSAFGPPRSIPLDRFDPLTGRREGGCIVASGEAGVLAVGPYCAVTHGRYRLICHFIRDGIAAEPDPGFTIDIWHNRGRAKCKSVRWRGPTPAVVDFTLSFDVTDLEFVIRLGAEEAFALLAFELAEAGPGDAPASDATI